MDMEEEDDYFSESEYDKEEFPEVNETNMDEPPPQFRAIYAEAGATPEPEPMLPNPLSANVPKLSRRQEKIINLATKIQGNEKLRDRINQLFNDNSSDPQKASDLVVDELDQAAHLVFLYYGLKKNLKRPNPSNLDTDRPQKIAKVDIGPEPLQPDHVAPVPTTSDEELLKLFRVSGSDGLKRIVYLHDSAVHDNWKLKEQLAEETKTNAAWVEKVQKLQSHYEQQASQDRATIMGLANEATVPSTTMYQVFSSIVETQFKVKYISKDATKRHAAHRETVNNLMLEMPYEIQPTFNDIAPLATGMKPEYQQQLSQLVHQSKTKTLQHVGSGMTRLIQLKHGEPVATQVSSYAEEVLNMPDDHDPRQELPQPSQDPLSVQTQGEDLNTGLEGTQAVN